MSPRRFLVALAALLLLMMTPLYGSGKKGAKEKAGVDGDYDALFAHYLKEAQQTATTDPGPAIAWMTDLAADPRAHNVNDLLTVHVMENISATGTANSELDKDSSGAAGLTNLFGLEKHLGFLDPANLANTSATTKFKGGGTTTRAGTLTADMTVRVAQVLPNGNLVLEGAREIEINGDKQVVVLTGVVRPTDVAPSNVVLSTSIAQLRIRYFGQGLMKDNLKPGLLVRILNKIF
ncbi:MAG: flagellar basal body L-ring protein FlgH [Acidobacteriota bacterium]|nr:flagellar basal body L-ring protein FlgH [Acidobacteriota bacterium]